jgi:peptide/nickel transport system substrate-binding protein
MSDKEHIWIPKLKQYLADGLMDRREFVRYSALLGMSAGAAYMWAGKITGQPFAPPARAAEMPKGGSLKIAMRVPKIETPHTFSWIYDSNITRQQVRYATRTGVDNVTRPDLVSWKASDDLKTWTLTVNDVDWYKGGKLTAEQVAWNIKHVLDPAVGSSVVGLMKGYMLKEVDSGKKDDKGNAVMTTELWDANAIEVKDDKTLVMNLKEAQVAVPEHLFHYPLAILDPEEGGKFGVGSNGNGFFELVEFEVGRKAVLKRREGAPGYLDEVQFIDLGDNTAAEAAAIQSRQVHTAYESNVEQYDLYTKMDHIAIQSATTANTGVARLRLDAKPGDDPKVRKAFRLATDVAKAQEIAVGTQHGEPAEHHHVCPVHPDYKKLPEMTRNVEEAKKLLAEAGYADGLDIEITCKPDPAWELAAVEAMVEQWKEANIRCKINVLPSSKFWDVWDKVPFGFTSWAHRPLGFMVLGLAYRTGVPWNESAYSNKEFDETLTKAEGTLDLEARKELIGRLEEIMQEDGPIIQPLWRKIFHPVDKAVKGYQIHPTRYYFCEEYAVEA